ncbi:MAG: FkbM family methyltransferase [Anaerolineales bacterium]|nr:FkbM family methyltransferase [Anaerolineales bacterium]
MRFNYEHFFHWFNKLIFSLLYLRHQGKSVVVIKVDRNTRFKVRVNTSDMLVIWEIWRAKVYDDVRIPIREGDVVVDMGAHIGAFAVRAARLAHRGQVYAYEASSKNCALLTENQQLNGLENLHIENSAVSNRRGQMPLYTPADNSILGSLLHETSGFIEMVQATTFSDIIADHAIEQIDLLKVDVEGAEFDILFACPDETLAITRRVVIEYHEFEGGERSHHDLVNLLNSHGFKVVVEKGIFPQPHWFGTHITGLGIIKAWR